MNEIATIREGGLLPPRPQVMVDMPVLVDIQRRFRATR